MLPRHRESTRSQNRFKSLLSPITLFSGAGVLGLVALGLQIHQNPEWNRAFFSFFSPATPKQTATIDPNEPDVLNANDPGLPLLGLTPSPEADRLKPAKDDKTKAKDANPINITLPSLETLLGGAPKSMAGTAGLGGSELGTPGLGAPGFATLNSNLSILGRSGSTVAMTDSQRNGSPLSRALNRYSPATQNPQAPFPVSPSEPRVTPSPVTTTAPIAGTRDYQPSAVGLPTVSPIAGASAINPALLSSPENLNSYTGLTSGAVGDTPDRGVAAPINRDSGVASPSLSRPSGITPSLPAGSMQMPPGTATYSPSTPIAVPVPEEPAFSAPRNTPGSTIGGGRIGTFSNP
jgi:hypothetical protein